MNLLVNAAHTISTSGNVTIATLMEKGWVQVLVADNGDGIALEHLPHIFDLFLPQKLSVSAPDSVCR